MINTVSKINLSKIGGREGVNLNLDNGNSERGFEKWKSEQKSMLWLGFLSVLGKSKFSS